MEKNVPDAGYPYNSVECDGEKLKDLVEACRKAGVKYRLGAKAHSLNAVPGRDYSHIDCSGFLRVAAYQASNGAIKMPDGSWIQRQWLETQGFKKSTVASAKLRDGRVRIAVMSPAAGGGVGHIALVFDGRTFESHGGVGPDSREWTGKGWQGKCAIFVLDAAPEADDDEDKPKHVAAVDEAESEEAPSLA